MTGENDYRRAPSLSFMALRRDVDSIAETLADLLNHSNLLERLEAAELHAEASAARLEEVENRLLHLEEEGG